VAEDLQPFLRANASVESDHVAIRALAAELGRGVADRAALARRLFLHVRDQVAYSVHNPFWLAEHYRASAILARGQGYCVQKSVLLCALARAAGMPARLLFADLVNHRMPANMRQMMGTDLFTYHCYAELMPEDRWLQATPSFDRNMCQRQDYPLVEFDGRQSAIFPASDHRGRRYMQYVHHYGAFADVPLEPMLASWRQVYGEARMARWMGMLPQQEGPA